MLIETLHTMMIVGFVAVWLLVGYVIVRETSRQRKASGPDAHRFDEAHAAPYVRPARSADRASLGGDKMRT
ncbi:MAG: hypothetical protein KDA63_20225 [Planctomycetales bacterium]|nr:hypothetical protein [Planctomycetales bacterium]